MSYMQLSEGFPRWFIPLACAQATWCGSPLATAQPLWPQSTAYHVMKRSIQVLLAMSYEDLDSTGEPTPLPSRGSLLQLTPTPPPPQTPNGRVVEPARAPGPPAREYRWHRA